MKKAVSVLMLSLIMVVVAACGSGNGNSNAGASPSASPSASASASASPSASPTESAAPAEVTITHASGETTVKTNPSKVVVFDMGILDSLDKLGVEVAGVPQNNLPAYLSKYEDAKYANVGGLTEPDFEKIAEIQPDLIIISGRQASSYEEFVKIAPTLNLTLDTAKYRESVITNMTAIGQVFNKSDEVSAELAALDAKVKEINEKVTAEGKKALIILHNEGSISAYGSGSRFGLIHDVFGFAQADENIEVSTHGQKVTFEYVAEKNPDYLFVVDRSAVVASEGGEVSPAKESIENDLVKGTNAYKDGHIVYLDPNYWYLSGGGLVSVGAMIDEVSAAIG